MDRKKIVVLSGSGISSESGIPTFRIAADSMWENYDVKTVCTHKAWEVNSDYVNAFYNMLRVKYKDVKPNDGHKLIAELEKDFDVTVITQNVDNLHEQAGSTNVLHLHGEMMKCCSEKDVENPKYWVNLPKEGFGETGLEIPEGQLADDGSLLRPYIVFFEEPVPNIEKAYNIIMEADIMLVVGTSLEVYPAAGVLMVYDNDKPLYVIDPSQTINENAMLRGRNFTHICNSASEGMKEFIEKIK